jgi:hypothetical protein
VVWLRALPYINVEKCIPPLLLLLLLLQVLPGVVGGGGEALSKQVHPEHYRDHWEDEDVAEAAVEDLREVWRRLQHSSSRNSSSSGVWRRVICREE